MLWHLKPPRETSKPFWAALFLFAAVQPGLGQTGATVPWTTYEAENMTVSGGTILGPGYFPGQVQAESSQRECVQLNATGQYVQFTAQAAANAIVVRYSVPDTSNGSGTNYTLGLYDNGTLIAELPVTSMYSWLYGAYPFNNNPSSGSPRNFFDEVRASGLTINAGDVIRLQKGPSDTASFYDIDLVDLENVPAAFTAPSNSLSIISYGANNTGATDSTSALENCVSAAVSQGKSVWMPSGTYLISSTINLPSNITIQGAGMWYTTLAGNPALYDNPADRVTFNGEGSNIHLANFAITGKLNYRNDSEPNDGLGGSYGAGSTISNLWVEHTKTGAWLVNSMGLVITGCRFRNTIADGCNLNLGMQGCVVSNCTCRGTGDDCFAVWPATYLTENYAPGSNVFTQCTGGLNFLANGCGLYGGTGNTVQNSLFQDVTYGCGVLISTTFAVGTNNFGGTTTAQGCEINRSGGYDPNFAAWRGAFQVCLALTSISNIFVNNMNITNSVSDGFSVISTASGVWLSNAVLANVSIPNYSVGEPGRNGLWAQSGTTGNLVVSNCSIAEYSDGSSTFHFIFVTNLPPQVQSMSYLQEPGNVIAGSNIAPAVEVQALGSNGLSISNASITLALSSGTGTLAGTLTEATDAGGVAHFTNLSLGTPGTKVLTATATPGAAPPANSISFTVLPLLPPAGQISSVTVNGSGWVTLTYGTTAGYQYHLEEATNLVSPTWTTMPGSAMTAATNTATYVDTNLAGGPQRFYRAVSP